MMETRLRRRQRLIFFILSVLLLGTIVISIGLGPASVSYDRLLPTLFGQGTFKEDFVLFSLRLPRIIITLLAGMALALSGSILQGITRNELADPGIEALDHFARQLADAREDNVMPRHPGRQRAGQFPA